MILVVGGMPESPEIVRLLREQAGIQGESSFRSSYGEQVSKGVVFLPRSQNCPMTVHLINKYHVHTVIDTAPISFKGASQKTMAACREKEIRYIRFEPPRIVVKGKGDVHQSENINEACDIASRLGKTVFLNVGNNHTETCLRNLMASKINIILRVSESGALAGAITLGMKTENIIFADRVFSKSFVTSLLKEYEIDLLVTRELGEGHGTVEELQAAESERIPVILVNRPEMKYPEVVNSYDQLLKTVLKRKKF